jgi:hypothetical protein
MAIILTKIANSETPYSIKYTVTGTDTEVPVIFPRATLLADLAEGPLKQYLTRITDSAWAQLNVEGLFGDKIRIYAVGSSIADASEFIVETVHIQWVSVPNPGLSIYIVSMQEGHTARHTFEIRYNHSTMA